MARKSAGFTNLIFSNQSKQIERLSQIFEDMEAQVDFVPIHIALHEGFISVSNKLACFTDHQIFERYSIENLHWRPNKRFFLRYQLLS